MQVRQFSSVSPSMPAIRSMLICGKPERTRECVCAADFGRPVRAAVQLEDAIVEVLDAQAEAGHAHPADGRQLGFGERAGLAFERNFARRRPGARCGEPRDETFELSRGQERWRAPAEVDEIDDASTYRRRGGVEIPLAGEQIEVRLDLLRVAVGIHPEVAEVAPFAAEGDVQVEAQRHAGGRGGR